MNTIEIRTSSKPGVCASFRVTDSELTNLRKIEKVDGKRRFTIATIIHPINEAQRTIEPESSFSLAIKFLLNREFTSGQDKAIFQSFRVNVLKEIDEKFKLN